MDERDGPAWGGKLALLAAVIVGLGILGSGLVRAQNAGPRLSRYTVGLASAIGGAPVPPAPAGTAAAGGPPERAATGSAAAVPTGGDPSRPAGVPLLRGDWMITKDYAAHGGLRPPPGNNQGAVDFAFYHNTDAAGAAVIATHSGRVKLLHMDPTYGNLVYVLGARWSTTYGHLQAFAVQDGQLVSRGQVIGQMGSTGQSSGPHVDYQVWENGQNRNPLEYCGCGLRGPDTPAE